MDLDVCVDEGGNPYLGHSQEYHEKTNEAFFNSMPLWEAVDALVDKANGTADAAQRTALYKQAGKTVMEAAVIIPIYNSDGLFVSSSSVKGVRFTVNAFPLFHNATA